MPYGGDRVDEDPGENVQAAADERRDPPKGTFDLSAISHDDSTDLYLKEMCAVPLLTQEQEIELAKAVCLGRKAARELEPEVRLLKGDTEAEPGPAARFTIRSIPTLILFRGGGEIARHSGAAGAGDLVRWVRTSLS